MAARKALFFHIANCVLFIGCLIVNASEAFHPLNGTNIRDLAEMDYNYFVPAPVTFSIWSVIYFQLIVFLIYTSVHLVKRNTEVIEYINIISPSFIVISLLNASWLIAYHYQETLLSVFIMALLVYVLIHIYTLIDVYNHRYFQPRIRRSILTSPFSLYLGWISVAMIANVASALVHFHWYGWGIPGFTWGIMVSLIAVTTSVMMLVRYQDYLFAFAAAWGLYGISIREDEHGLTDFAGFNETVFYISIALLCTIVFTYLARLKVKLEAY